MASLILKLSPERTISLGKSVTSLGRGPQNDVRIAHDSVKERHAHVLKDRRGYRIFATEGASLIVNGKRRPECALSDGDRIQLGEVLLVYRDQELMAEEITDAQMESPLLAARREDLEKSSREGSITESVPLEAFKKLYRFSAKLSQSPDLHTMKVNLVDAVIDLAGGDSAFLLVTQGDGFEIDVGRSRNRTDLPREEARLSDSIVQDVLRRRGPVLISDAMEDSVFAESRSVMNYKLRSVVAVPIVLGEEILGVLYLACDQRASAFSRDYLDVLMVFAAQAGLLVKNATLVTQLRQDNQALKEELDARTFGEIVGGSSSMQGIFKAVSRFAPTDISVLITGETGTGKELIAREIHRRSARAEGPFVAINMSAIPDNLLEAELFGHTKGAFTGAVAERRGKFTEADGGTLFLDEIGDLPLSLQAKLLRVIQERQIVPVGSNVPQPIDIRIISATHQDLERMQEEGAFRADLYFRLNEVQVSLPPLRERGEDIPLLASYFLTKYGEQMNRRLRRFTPRALAAMKRFKWRGNVRELEARVKKAVVMAEGPDIDLDDMELSENAMTEVLNLREAKEVYALRYIKEVLELNNGNRSKTARDLGVDPRTIYKYLEGK
ncbi:MAG: sigma 54-interacting transcriptional regulator [Deltaproteobacteria bacterium]|nr:sigma 54-interacting transcriptional regulator [Deltaproteobacteria bacterium]